MTLSYSPAYLHWGLIDFNVTISNAAGSNTLPTGRILPVRQGVSVPFIFSRGDLSVSGWVCNITVKKFPDDTSLISRTIALGNGNVWSGYLTSTETTALGLGTYRLTGVLTNATTDEEEQQIARFSITESWGT